jgi:hypothetical protein
LLAHATERIFGTDQDLFARGAAPAEFQTTLGDES